MNNEDGVVLEGFHACKHALRFGAEITELVTPDKTLLQKMLQEHAPDIQDAVLEQVTEVTQEQFAKYSNISIRTPLAGKATKPSLRRSNLLSDGLVVLLDNPRDLENIGAVVRLAAGMECAGVVITGDVDPWHKNCLRGSQGLHFALPVLHIDSLDSNFLLDKTVIAFDERGVDISQVQVKGVKNLILIFGSERAGMSEELKEQSKFIVKIPQKNGVASYNLATSVAMGVYHYKMNK